jgi:hypothetical protein
LSDLELPIDRLLFQSLIHTPLHRSVLRFQISKTVEELKLVVVSKGMQDRNGPGISAAQNPVNQILTVRHFAISGDVLEMFKKLT